MMWFSGVFEVGQWVMVDIVGVVFWWGGIGNLFQHAKKAENKNSELPR